jgi:predicted molibdopterin-dependent oxidoreductase YjgC
MITQKILVENILKNMVNEVSKKVSVHTEVTYNVLSHHDAVIYMVNKAGNKGVTLYELQFVIDYLENAGIHVYWVEPDENKLKLQARYLKAIGEQ